MPVFYLLLSPKQLAITDLASERYLALETFVTFYTEDGETSVLAGLGHAEEDGPEDALGRDADGEEHLGKGEDVEGNATGKDDDARAEGK